MTDSGHSHLIAPWLMSTGCLPFMAHSRAPFFRFIPVFCAPIALKNLLPDDTSRPPPHFAGRRFREVNRGKGGLLPTPLHLPGHPISVRSAAASACDGVGTSSEGYPNRCGDGQPCVRAPPVSSGSRYVTNTHKILSVIPSNMIRFLVAATVASVERHGVHPAGCIDNQPDPSRGF